MKIYSHVPTRIGLIGGGTDVNPFASAYGGKILSFAVNLRHNVYLEPSKNKRIHIQALNQTVEKELDEKLTYGKEKDFDLIYAIINYFKPFIKSGFRLEIKFDGESSGGLGSSGSAAVAIIGAFNHWLNRKLSRMEIASLAWRMETEELKWHGGKQDQLAAVFGGINLLIFGDNDSSQAIPLELSKALIKKIREWTVLLHTGGKRHSSDLQKKLYMGMLKKNKIQALKNLKKNVGKIIKALKKEEFDLVGEILDKSWEFKKKSNPDIAGLKVNNIYALAKENGALGGKVMGAGAGGYMFFFCPPQKQRRLIKALKKESVKLIDFDFDFDGLKVNVKK